MKLFTQYLRHLEELKPTFEELQHLEPKQIARVLIDRRILNFKGKVDWSVHRVGRIRQFLALNKNCEDIVEYRLPFMPRIVAERLAKKKQRFEE